MRENARGILALAYNRHAAVEIRRRLAALIGEDAKGVTVLTCHALAMRLAGLSFAGRAQKVDDDLLKTVIPQAVALLKGEGLPVEEADEQRERLLAGFRWILVDEYQDMTADQYDLISALAGRTPEDPEGKLVMSIAANRAIKLGGTDVKWADLEAKLKSNERVQRESQIYIEADKDLPYAVVITAMAIAKNANVSKVMMLTEPTDTLMLSDLDAGAVQIKKP
jgi:biopolymer transport protein ExbD